MSDDTTNIEIKDEVQAEAADATDEVSESVESEEVTAEADPLQTLAQECESLRDQLLRQRAEFDNYRKRMARDTEQIRKTATENLIRDILPVLDNLERALQHAEDPNGALAQGVSMVLKQLCDALAAKGLEPIASVGEAFDPNVHEAMAQQPSEDTPADMVLNEFERGYRLGGFVIRPAKVVISSGPAQSGAAEQGKD
jgi:molecular chaperone GrpE